MRTRINVESGIADFVMELDVDVNTLKFGYVKSEVGIGVGV